MSAEPAEDSRDEFLMDAVRQTWVGLYDVGDAGGSFLARRITGGDLIGAETPAGLESAIRADFVRWTAG